MKSKIPKLAEISDNVNPVGDTFHMINFIWNHLKITMEHEILNKLESTQLDIDAVSGSPPYSIYEEEILKLLNK